AHIDRVQLRERRREGGAASRAGCSSCRGSRSLTLSRGDPPPALDRILGRLGEGRDLIDQMASLSRPDLTTVLMAVAAERARRVDAAAVLRQYERDRFVRPSAHDVRSLRAAEEAFLRATPVVWEWTTLAPVVPFGTHAALGDLSENRVLAALRALEV